VKVKNKLLLKLVDYKEVFHRNYHAFCHTHRNGIYNMVYSMYTKLYYHEYIIITVICGTPEWHWLEKFIDMFGYINKNELINNVPKRYMPTLWISYMYEFVMSFKFMKYNKMYYTTVSMLQK
jgi:hypothetical protein